MIDTDQTNYPNNILTALSAFLIWLSSILQDHYFIGLMTGLILVLTAINYVRGIRNKKLIADKLQLEIDKLRKDAKN